MLIEVRLTLIKCFRSSTLYNLCVDLFQPTPFNAGLALARRQQRRSTSVHITSTTYRVSHTDCIFISLIF